MANVPIATVDDVVKLLQANIISKTEARDKLGYKEPQKADPSLKDIKE